MADGWLQVAQEALKAPGVLVEIYGDLARPGVKQVGKALDTVLGFGNTILWPIALANERSRLALERNLEKYRREMAKVAEDKVVGVSPELGVPIAEKIGYVQDERLSDLYIRLLATASNQDTVGHAHPSFVNVINNLSPDEAHLLAFFSHQPNLPICFAIARGAGGAGTTHKALSGPLVDVGVVADLHFPENVDAYLSNLEGLGLVSIDSGQWLSGDQYYEPIESSHRPRFTELVASHRELAGDTLHFKRGLAKLSSFGRKFILACHRE